ncbi:DUF3954 domain-containing protein [Bacillus mycoides]|uniref:Phage protein n=1 Tax=Bacillus cereus VD021 TaxID=1053224 RepID=R8HR11_BACCE|nr:MULTISPECIES: DUF3954 domain-containing protein [Bacillus]EJS58171.1 hypothetical protein ICG_01910 [Bacillus cereus BAG1X1-3]EOO75221.1 hypothetical protein IIC_02368 [Bacillus cereus VD021]MBG9688785.1 phage protein [Bacillus mycoides]MBJ8093135.1 DUF3954 domain-containing protein [Bacillus cereus]MED1115779.1 DUF3954 domain-containing protein [Bacillus paramycoides]
MKAEIDVTKNQIFVVNEGVVTSYEQPKTGYGEQMVIWVNGKAIHVKTTYIEKLK